MGWKPVRARPLGKPGSAEFPQDVIGKSGPELARAWKQVRAERALAAAMERILKGGGPGPGKPSRRR